MMRNVAIVHFNTPELTAALVKSIHKRMEGCRVTVFDNSDRRPFAPMDGVDVIDNTRGQVIDFEALLSKYPDQRSTDYYQASAKHIASVDYLFDVLTEGFVLMDSDVLVKREFGEFFDPRYALVGTVERQYEAYKALRMAPYLLWLNVPMLREAGIRFWHEGMVYKLSHNGTPFYDTGASVYHDCLANGLPILEEPIYKYIDHLGEGSFRRAPEEVAVWLERRRAYYE